MKDDQPTKRGILFLHNPPCFCIVPRRNSSFRTNIWECNMHMTSITKVISLEKTQKIEWLITTFLSLKRSGSPITFIETLISKFTFLKDRNLNFCWSFDLLYLDFILTILSYSSERMTSFIHRHDYPLKKKMIMAFH